MHVLISNVNEDKRYDSNNLFEIDDLQSKCLSIFFVLSECYFASAAYPNRPSFFLF